MRLLRLFFVALLVAVVCGCKNVSKPFPWL
jgi:hypothetical protein